MGVPVRVRLGAPLTLPRRQRLIPSMVDGLISASIGWEARIDFYSRKYWSATNENWNLMIPPSGSGWFTYIYTFNDLDCSTRIIGDWLNHDVFEIG